MNDSVQACPQTGEVTSLTIRLQQWHTRIKHDPIRTTLIWRELLQPQIERTRGHHQRDEADNQQGKLRLNRER